MLRRRKECGKWGWEIDEIPSGTASSPELGQGNLQIVERRKRNGCVSLASTRGDVAAILQFPPFQRFQLRIGDPVIPYARFAVLSELVFAVDLAAAGTEHLDGQIGNAFHVFFADAVEVLVRVEEDIGPAN